MRTLTAVAAVIALALGSAAAQAADYVIDKKGMHASVQFRVKHLGYSWLRGRFNDFSGTFKYDANRPDASSVEVTIDISSLDSNHGSRDRHLKGSDFFDARRYPEARFVSTSYRSLGADRGRLRGNLTLRGLTRPVTIAVTRVGEGKDPWGGYRAGFEGRTEINILDFNFPDTLGPPSRAAEIILDIEGVRR